MRNDFTDITLVLDRSGSMGSVKRATIEAVNGYVDSQKSAPGSANFTLVQFDDQYEVVHDNVPVTGVPALTDATYQPRGSTALLDAIGRSIVNTGNRLSAMQEHERPATVLFVIQTDGEENSSREYTLEKVNEMIAHQRDAYQWQFVFLGANQDAIANAAKLGIGAHSSMSYAATAQGTKAAFAGVARSTHKLRAARASGDMSASYQTDDSDRQAAMS